MLSKYPVSFTTNFTEKVGTCAFSVYQALSPLLKGTGDEAIDKVYQGVVTAICPVLPAATAIKNFDR